MKKFSFLFFTFFLIGLQSLHAAESEPNNTAAQANTLALNGSNSGKINPAGDVDWWKVTTNGDGRLDITLSPLSNKYTWVYLYDNDGTTLIDSKYSASAFTLAADGLQAGTYYIKIATYYSSDTSSYNISNALVQPAQANDAEPNNTKAQAKVLPLNGSRTGHIGYYYNNTRDTADWWQVTTTADGRLDLSLTPHASQYVWIYLYDNDGTTLIDSKYSASAYTLSADGLAAGTYYLKVKCYYSYDFSPYTISSALVLPAEANDTEPNNTKAQSKVLTFNGSKTGHVGYYYNNQRDTSDWWRVTTNADGQLSLTLTPAVSDYVWVYLYDNDGTTLISSKYGSSAFTLATDGLQAGTYYVQVKCYYSYKFAPYTISDSLHTYNNDADQEPNDKPYLAKTLITNTATPGHVGFYYNNTRDTFDWYKINYTGADNGNLIVALNFEKVLGENNFKYLYMTIYRDTAATPLYNTYNATGTLTANLTAVTKGYYWVRIKCYYNYQFESYNLTASFAQQNKAAVNVVSATAVNSCDASNSIKLQCSGSSAPYTVELYRFGVYYSTTTANSTAAFTIAGLPTGYYSAKVYGDGASGDAFGTSTGVVLEPTPSGLASSAVKSDQAKISWTGYNGCVLGYKLQYKEASASSWITKYLFNTSTTLKGLSPATTYQWRVAAGDSANGFIALSPNSATASFTTTSAFAAEAAAENSAVSKTIGNGGVVVYPNPVQNAFTIQLGALASNTKISATLRNMNSNIVWSRNTTASALNNTRVDATGFAAGIYILQVTDLDHNTTISTKVVIAR